MAENGYKDVAALINNVYRQSEVPNEPSISQWSFRRMFDNSPVENEYIRVDSGDIEGRQRKNNRIRPKVEL